MPYYVFKIQAGVSNLVKNLQKLDEFENFKDAKNFVKEQRSKLLDGEQITFKVIFADNELEAEERLQEHRETPILREWEK